MTQHDIKQLAIHAMTREDKNMDKTCAWFETLIAWVERQEQSPLHYAGMGASFGNHPAEFLELVCLTEGDISDLTMGSMRTSLKMGQVGLFNVHFGNVAAAHDQFRGWCVFLDTSNESQFDMLRESPLAVIVDVRDHARVNQAFAHVVERCRLTTWTVPKYPHTRTRKRKTRPAAQTLLKAALLELLGVLLDESQSVSARGPSATVPTELSSALALMHRQYHEPDLGRQDLAAVAGLHPDHFGRLFQKHYQLSPMRYLMRLRVEQACFLLRQTTQRIEPIAQQVGFVDPYHFSRVFKGYMGCSPRAYRQRVGKRQTNTQ